MALKVAGVLPARVILLPALETGADGNGIYLPDIMSIHIFVPALVNP